MLFLKELSIKRFDVIQQCAGLHSLCLCDSPKLWSSMQDGAATSSRWQTASCFLSHLITPSPASGHGESYCQREQVKEQLFSLSPTHPTFALPVWAR